MNKQEKLQERYEDALFAIMMDELASSLGQEALEENERLKADPTAAVPDQIEKKCLKTIRKHFRMASIKKVGQVSLSALGKAAMVFGIACALFVGAFATSENVRITTMNLVVETFGESTDFYFAPPVTEIPQIKATWVPDGFALDKESKDETGSQFSYRNNNGQYIRGRYVEGEGCVVSVDTENSNVSPVDIHGVEAMLVEKDGRLQIVWGIKDKSGFIELFCNGLSVEELIQVAENVEY